MKILVTGAAGFIGFHLIKGFLEENHVVTGIDSINDYYDVNLKYGRLEAIGIGKTKIKYNEAVKSIINEDYTFYQLTLEDNENLVRLFEKENFDIVINLAAQAGVRHSLKNPHSYIQSNIVGFLNVLECCHTFAIKHLIYASSSSVYGLNNNDVLSTEQAVDHPVSIYAASKRSNELMAHVYSHLYNIPTTGLRFFTVYGPWGRPDMALFLFTKKILEGQPISVFNNGNMLRDFTYIDDIIEGIKRIASVIPAQSINALPGGELKPNTSSAPFNIYNIGNNSPVKLLDFIEILENELGKTAVKEFLPMQEGEIYSTHADVTPLMRDFQYKPSTTISFGVKEFVKWYRDFYKL